MAKSKSKSNDELTDELNFVIGRAQSKACDGQDWSDRLSDVSLVDQAKTLIKQGADATYWKNFSQFLRELGI